MIRDYIQPIDLHIHTSNSDGQFSLIETINQIKEKGIKTFSITDHDCLKSYYEIQNINLKDLKYIPGIELSAKLDEKYNIHILAYNYKKEEFLEEICQRIRLRREERFLKYIQNLKTNFNISIDKNLVENCIKTSFSLGRPQLTTLLQTSGIKEDRDTIYQKYIQKSNPNISYREDAKIVFDAIKKSCGKAFLAHPIEVEEEYKIEISEILPKLIDLGLQGIESHHSKHDQSHIKKYHNLALEFNLLESSGSDYHGKLIKPNVEIGKCFLQ